MRLLTALEPCTSLLGGMWSPTTLPLRCPQWWHPSLPRKVSISVLGPKPKNCQSPCPRAGCSGGNRPCRKSPAQPH